MAKVSIIVPIHNAGKYLCSTLESLIHQTLTDIEVILVLDCPTDGSDSIAEKYATKDSRIVIIRNIENLHVGFSRNVGLEIATGEYIGFCDHDDTITTDMFEKLYYKGKETNAEIVVSDYWIACGGKKWYRGIPQSISSTEFIQKQFSALVNFQSAQTNKRLFENNQYIWNHLFQRDLLSKHHIVFPDNRITTFEDRVFLQKVYANAQNVATIPQSFYTHIWHTNNAGASYNFKAIKNVTTYLTDLYHFLLDRECLQREKENYIDCIILSLYTSFRHELRHRSLSHTLRQLIPIRNNHILQTILHQAYPRLKHFQLTKIMFFFMILNPVFRTPHSQNIQ